MREVAEAPRTPPPVRQAAPAKYIGRSTDQRKRVVERPRGLPPPRVNMAEHRRNVFRAMLSEAASLTEIATRSVDKVLGMGRSVASLIRYATARIRGLMHFQDDPANPAVPDTAGRVQANAIYPSWNDWLATPDLAARDEQLDRFVEHIVIQTIVSE